MHIQIWSTEKNKIFIRWKWFRKGASTLFFFLTTFLINGKKICNWTHSLKQVHFTLEELFPQPELPWKDTQYRQKNTNRTSNFWHTHLCQSYDTNQQVLGEIALRSPSYVALSPVAADARYQELSDGFLPFLLAKWMLRVTPSQFGRAVSYIPFPSVPAQSNFIVTRVATSLYRRSFIESKRYLFYNGSSYSGAQLKHSDKICSWVREYWHQFLF